MKQQYHSNATTNVHIRSQIKESDSSNVELAKKYSTSVATIFKWKNRKDTNDLSSRPKNINYALTLIEIALALAVRRTSWLPLDEIWEMILDINPVVSRSSIYRLFQRNKINTVPQKEKEKAKKFKEYEPGYIHVDVTYLPKFNGIKCYLFVAIDRATRLMYYKVYEAKTSENTEAFMLECIDFFPFKLTHVLTDNGLEFTNRLLKSKKGKLCTKPSKLDEICKKNKIDHRLTKPGHPQTNGMVERVNGTIKNGTILREVYKSKEDMILALNLFLIHYVLYKRHGGIRRELKVKTPFNALQKWYELKPEIFNQSPDNFKLKFLTLFKT